MTDLDRKIEEALALEDEALKNQFDEQGIFTQWFSTYQGKQGWLATLTTIVMMIMAIVAFFAIWKLFQVEDSLDMLKWGGLALLMMTMVSFMKVWFWMRMESNRVIREIKRMELQLVRLQAKIEN